jgi:Holliday junction resolvasome RuvABC endonuclease subunit
VSRTHILAIDPAEHMGLAWWCSTGPVQGSKAIRLQGKTRPDRLAFALGMLGGLFADASAIGAPITRVFCEEGWQRLGDARAVFKLEGIIEAACAHAGVPLTLVQANKWRKTFLGYGTGRRASLKKAVIAQCQRLGHEPHDDNEADAIGLLHHGRCLLDPDYAVASTRLFYAGRAA